MNKKKPLIIKNCKATLNSDYKKRIDAWLKELKPKVIETYEENGVTITKYEAR